MKLKDKVAIVTGGARGIGEAVVRAYSAEGAKVVIADIEIAKAQELASELGANALAVKVDVRDSKSISSLISATVSKFGSVDILYNNAGVFDMGPILEISEASFDKVFSVNTRGLFFTLQAAAAQMVKQGRGGKIINMASQAGLRVQGGGHQPDAVRRA
jgi:D-sorbitol dehydrogenase (acceptor)